MAKILVADDNSNVQKTVTLALEELGVDVVAVNNGEAAVRKLSEVAPDLVLADIFMPVRNGYELCEYIKKNPRFAHVPVVLLVGAFDPLDEREAQRVGADGILKKPFVPPGPLIAMVKSLLERIESEHLVMASVARVPQTGRMQSDAAGNGEEPPTPALAQAPPAQAPEEPEEFSMTPEPVAFGEGEHPVAFGTLFDAPEAEASLPTPETINPVDEQVLTSQRDATLGEPAFWRNESEETGSESEAPPDGQSEAHIEPKDNSPEQSATPYWDTLEDSPIHAHAESSEDVPEAESLELVRDEQDETSPSVEDSMSILLDPAAQSQLTVQPGPLPDLAANPLEWMATVPVAPSDARPEIASEESEPPSEPIPPVELSADTAPSDSAAPATPPEPEVKAAQLAAELSTPPEAAANLSSTEETPEPSPGFPDFSIEIIPPEADAPQAATTEPDAPPSETPRDVLSKPDPVLVEAVVQRVLEKMRPQVVDIITKEFLRPVVQALVHREIEKQ